MPNLNFPASPTDGQTYTEAVTQAVWTYNSAYGVWRLTTVQSRVFSIANANTHIVNSDNTDAYIVTAQATGATFGKPSGSPKDNQKLTIRIKDAGTGAQTMTFNASTGGYNAGADVPFPTTTTAGKVMYLGFMYNSANSRFDLVAKVDNL